MDPRHTPVIVGSSFEVCVEQFQGVSWLHCDVVKFTPSVLRELKAAWRQFTAKAERDFYVLRDTQQGKPTAHFLRAAGFVKHKDVPGTAWEIWKLGNVWAGQ